METTKSTPDAVQTTKSTQHMTEFGRTLFSLMLTRGMEHRQDLLEALKGTGYTISQSRLSYYLNGERKVDPAFVVHVSDLLELTKAERQRLAWAFAYGQG